MTKWYDRDRALGAALPSVIDAARLAARWLGLTSTESAAPDKTEPTTRVASRIAALAAGYEPTDEPDMYRKAHAIWALRPAEDDGGGFVLVRLRDEPAVDRRVTAAATITTSPDACTPSTGDRVSFVRCGQRIDGVVVKVDIDNGMADVQPDDSAAMLMGMPMEQLAAPCGCGGASGSEMTAGGDAAPMIVELVESLAGEDAERPSAGFEPEVEPSSKQAQHLNRDTDFDTMWEVMKPFTPALHARGHIPEGTLLTLDGFFPADPKADAFQGVPNPVYSSKASPEAMVRYRFKAETGEDVFVLPFEMTKYMSRRGGAFDAPAKRAPKREPIPDEDMAPLRRRDPRPAKPQSAMPPPLPEPNDSDAEPVTTQDIVQEREDPLVRAPTLLSGEDTQPSAPPRTPTVSGRPPRKK